MNVKHSSYNVIQKRHWTKSKTLFPKQLGREGNFLK